jgi:hypothetical protein
LSILIFIEVPVPNIHFNMEGRCMTCKKQVPVKDGQLVRNARDGLMVKGVCGKCGTKVNVMTSEEKALKAGFTKIPAKKLAKKGGDEDEEPTDAGENEALSVGAFSGGARKGSRKSRNGSKKSRKSKQGGRKSRKSKASKGSKKSRKSKGSRKSRKSKGSRKSRK